MTSKKPTFAHLSEVQRALNQSAVARECAKPAPLFFGQRNAVHLYPIMRSDTLRNTSTNWRAQPEVLSKARALMVERLRVNSIGDSKVWAAMALLPRHVFLDDAFYLRAYHDDALPIGYGQTISHPSTVARMIALLRSQGELTRVLEIGTGCGYQAALLTLCATHVFSIERIEPLYRLALDNITRVQRFLARPPQLSFGDGTLGLPNHAPFDGIIIAAAGLSVPQALLQQLRIGGVLVAPVQMGLQKQQVLIKITRLKNDEWQREIIDDAKFVPLLDGTQSESHTGI